MLSETLWKISNLQQKLLSALDSGLIAQESHLQEQLLQTLNELVYSVCRTKEYAEYNSYFISGVFADPELVDSSAFTDAEYELLEQFCHSSNKLYKKMMEHSVNGGKSLEEGSKLSHCDSTNLNTMGDEAKQKILRASERVSLSMDLGGTFIKIMFKIKLGNARYYRMLKNVYAAYRDTLNFAHRLSNHTKLRGFNPDIKPDTSKMTAFLFAVFLALEVRDGILVFKYLPISELTRVISTIKELNLHPAGMRMNLTGGGAFKYYDLLASEFGEVAKFDEVSCVVRGISFIQGMHNSVLEYDLINRVPRVFTMEPVYPYIVSSIGSGTFFLKVDSESEFRHVTGTSISGGTAFGLVNYLLPLDQPRKFLKNSTSGTNKLDTFSRHPDQAFETANKSEPYGLYQSLGEFDPNRPEVWYVQTHMAFEYSAEDLNKSLVDMISYNTGTLGYLVAKAFECKRLIFIGNFLRTYTIDSIAAGFAYTGDIYGDSSVQLCFPFHGPYISIIGCFNTDT